MKKLLICSFVFCAFSVFTSDATMFPVASQEQNPMTALERSRFDAYQLIEQQISLRLSEKIEKIDSLPEDEDAFTSPALTNKIREEENKMNFALMVSFLQNTLAVLYMDDKISSPKYYFGGFSHPEGYMQYLLFSCIRPLLDGLSRNEVRKIMKDNLNYYLPFRKHGVVSNGGYDLIMSLINNKPFMDLAQDCALRVKNQLIIEENGFLRSLNAALELHMPHLISGKLGSENAIQEITQGGINNGSIEKAYASPLNCLLCEIYRICTDFLALDRSPEDEAVFWEGAFRRLYTTKLNNPLYFRLFSFVQGNMARLIRNHIADFANRSEKFLFFRELNQNDANFFFTAEEIALKHFLFPAP
ncbi:MAG: hypothetical protein LBT70_01395 [Holosporaceae bacterium]|nr:hypothetical protein [Holosporaceae bacterium]